MEGFVGIVITAEEKVLVDSWAGQIAAAMIACPGVTSPGPLDMAREAYNIAMKLLEVRRDAYKDRS